MQTLIIYDIEGYLISVRNGEPAPREPIGVPFMWVEIPEGKRITGVDVSVTPHQPIFEDLPPTEVDLLRIEMAQSNVELFEMMLMLTSGGAE